MGRFCKTYITPTSSLRAMSSIPRMSTMSTTLTTEPLISEATLKQLSRTNVLPIASPFPLPTLPRRPPATTRPLQPHRGAQGRCIRVQLTQQLFQLLHVVVEWLSRMRWVKFTRRGCTGLAIPVVQILHRQPVIQLGPERFRFQSEVGVHSLLDCIIVSSAQLSLTPKRSSLQRQAQTLRGNITHS
jgi:hypothetical protein